MPTGLRCAKVKNTSLTQKLNDKISINQQLNIWGENSFSRQGYIEYIGKSEFGNYDKYKISYYEVEKVNGYYKETQIKNLLVEEEKFFFLSPEKDYILIRASKKDSYKIIRLLQQSGQIDILEKELDMKEVRTKLSCNKNEIKSFVGAWITNLENVNINTVAIFGAEIDQSEEFGDYISQEESKISILIIDFGEETIAITHQYGAIFYNRRSELRLLEGYEVVKSLLSGIEMFI